MSTIRMLHITASMSPSGIGNFIMNAYRNVDRELVQFDFAVCEHRDVSFDDEIRQMGGRVFYITRKSVSPWKNFQEIKDLVKRGGYQIVFRHTDVSTVALDLLAAKLGGARVRIAHSHSTSAGKIWLHKLFRPFLNAVCTERFACSQDAGRWMYGSRKKFRIIMNGIDIPRFTYDKGRREAARKALGISEGTMVIGHVGNYMPVKNHAFMIELFAGLHEKRPDSRLLLVGDGSLRPQMEKQIEEAKITDAVSLTGVRNDIADLLQAMDLFLFPSFYEGMPIALVEAQTAGLPCLISDVITEDVCVTDQVRKLPLSAGVQEWAKTALELLRQAERTDRAADAGNGKGMGSAARVKEAGFDVRALGEVYNEMAK